MGLTSTPACGFDVLPHCAGERESSFPAGTNKRAAQSGPSVRCGWAYATGGSAGGAGGSTGGAAALAASVAWVSAVAVSVTLEVIESICS